MTATISHHSFLGPAHRLAQKLLDESLLLLRAMMRNNHVKISYEQIGGLLRRGRAGAEQAGLRRLKHLFADHIMNSLGDDPDLKSLDRFLRLKCS